MDNTHKKLLLVTRNFPPLVGGMENLNLHICKSLVSSFHMAIAGPEGSAQIHKLKNFIEFPVRPLWRYVAFSLGKSIFLALRIKPNIVFCGSGAAILAGYFSAKLTGASLVCYLHGLDVIVDSKIYQWIFLPLIKRSNLILVNSKHTCGLAIAAGVDPLSIKILSPGVELPNFSTKIDASQQFRLKFNIGNAPFLLIAGRITTRKGIAEFIRNIMPNITAAHPELQLIIIGDEAVDAMKCSFGVKDNIIATVDALNLHANVKLIGSVDDAMFSAAFFAAEMLIFPVLNIANDVEGFGMVAIEAAAHGLPTIGFSVGGIPDAISHNHSGWLVEAGDYPHMSSVILNAYSSAQFGTVTSESCIEFSKQFSWECFKTKLNDSIKDL
jgi:phosphatidylinositol alpha-1,6-mannosyltransferase